MVARLFITQSLEPFIQSNEKLEVNLVWMNLPGLLLEWWTIHCLTTLGNRPGGFIVVDEDMNISLKRTVVKILVNLKVTGGLYASIDLVMGNK